MSSPVEKSRTRSDVVGALNQALLVASPEDIVERNLKISGNKLKVLGQNIDISQSERILVIGGGKASASMAAGIEKILDGSITAGFVNVPEHLSSKPRIRKIELHEATHPVPSEKGLIGVKRMLDLVGTPTKNDLVICLISGGGSALMPMPAEGLRLSDERKVTEMLLRSGARINEINAVRKHLSGIKGGRLAKRLYPARVITLIISDVVGDDLGSIASGPTVPDKTTYSDVKKILANLGLWKKIPKRVKIAVEKGLHDTSLDTPKQESVVFKNVSNLLIGTNLLSCTAAESYLKKRGYSCAVLSTRVQGEAKEVAKVYSAIMSEMKRRSALVFGGETTTTIRGKGGKGGRNQELVLSAAIGISGLAGVVVASMGTDGVDGPTDAAGAIADSNTVMRGTKHSLNANEFLESHNSYKFFERLGDLIVTGPTGTNVNDITILARK